MKKLERLEYLESGRTPPPPAKKEKLEEDSPLDESFRYPLLARYDFAGAGPRPGYARDERMYRLAANLRTRGERLVPILTQIGWTIVRIVVSLVLIYIFLYGRTFNCAGGGFHFG